MKGPPSKSVKQTLQIVQNLIGNKQRQKSHTPAYEQIIAMPSIGAV